MDSRTLGQHPPVHEFRLNAQPSETVSKHLKEEHAHLHQVMALFKISFTWHCNF